jgi:hypothetical protein
MAIELNDKQAAYAEAQVTYQGALEWMRMMRRVLEDAEKALLELQRVRDDAWEAMQR